MTTSSDEIFVAQTYGPPFFLKNPKATDVHIPSLIVSMGHLTRYNGHTYAPMTLAMHSDFVTQLVRLRWPQDLEAAIYAKVHDCHESIWGDMLRPVQILLEEELTSFREVWKKLCISTDIVIFEALGLPRSFPSTQAVTRVKQADSAALTFERRALMGCGDQKWPDDETAAWWKKAEWDAAQAPGLLGFELKPKEVTGEAWYTELTQMIFAWLEQLADAGPGGDDGAGALR